MKVSFNRLEALPLTKAASSIAPSHSPIEALKGVLLEASEDGYLSVSATNLEVALRRRIRANVSKAGALVLNARIFAGMLELLEGDIVTICSKGDQLTDIYSGSTHYFVSALSAKDFPHLDFTRPKDTVVVTDIPAITRKTAFAVSDNDEKPLMKCVNLVFTSEGLTAVGCDGIRLASAKGTGKSTDSMSLLVPAASLDKLAHLVSSKDALHVGTTGKSIVFTKDDFVFSARLMEGDYIDAERMLSGVVSNFTVLTDAATLSDAVSSSTTISGNSNSFSLAFSESKLKINCESENGIATYEVDVVPLSGTPSGEYWYSYKQLLGCLKALSGTLILEVGQNGILLMRTDDLVCLQVPMRKPKIHTASHSSKRPGKRAKAA